MENTKPLLRWAGGKSWFIKHIHKYLPNEFRNYHEPFIGGASVFIHLKKLGLIKGRAYLSDFNPELINTYAILRDSPQELFEVLKSYKNESEFYYHIRSSSPDSELLRAARFIYLNRTSFNGIYRENLKGEYNVPFGHRDLKTMFELKDFIAYGKLLNRARLLSCDFESTLKNIKRGDLVFIDPPYTVAHENNGFVKYNQKIFSWEDQVRLKNFINKINNKGAYYIMTNAAHKCLDELYDGIGEKDILSRASNIGGVGAKREKYHEYIFYNFKLNET